MLIKYLNIFFCCIYFKGNGHESDFVGDNRVYIIDFYNEQVYPRDEPAKSIIFYFKLLL